MRTQPIRIEIDRVQKVREHVANTKQTISGFIALAIDDKLKPWAEEEQKTKNQPKNNDDENKL